MNKNIWQACQGEKHIAPLVCNAWRVVEAQHISSTRKLVDTLQEHDILEHLIESVKPPIPDQSIFKGLHYLLASPFRYPPLKHGSRFGTRHEPSLWYGSFELNTALAEVAHYRFDFIKACDAELGLIECPMSAYAVGINAEKGLDLTADPFAEFTSTISSPKSIAASQGLGCEMRAAGLHAFVYQSARCKNAENNIGVLSPEAFAAKAPKANSLQTWVCHTDKSQVEFVQQSCLEARRVVFSTA